MKTSPIEAVVFQNNQIELTKNLSFSDILNMQKKKNKMMVFIQDEISSGDLVSFLKELEVHPLIIADILSSNQRAKIEMIDDSIFCVLGFLERKKEQLELKTNKMSLIMTHDMVLVVSPKQLKFKVDEFVEHYLLVSNHPQLDISLYYLLQNILNNFFDIMDDSVEQLELLEEYLITTPKKINLKDLYFLRRNFLMLRKILLPILDASDTLAKFKTSFIEPDTKLYFQNMYEQTNRTMQSLDFYQHMVSNIHDTYLSSVNNIMNRSIAMITKFATIFIPITFITGIYGMNFELGFYANSKGFFIVLGCMGLLAGVMSWFLKSKKFDIEVQ